MLLGHNGGESDGEDGGEDVEGGDEEDVEDVAENDVESDSEEGDRSPKGAAKGSSAATAPDSDGKRKKSIGWSSASSEGPRRPKLRILNQSGFGDEMIVATPWRKIQVVWSDGGMGSEWFMKMRKMTHY